MALRWGEVRNVTGEPSMPESISGSLSSGLQIGAVDLAIILVYLVGIVGIGCWAGFRRKSHEGDTYFLGGRTITWPVIGAALFASNISTVHMVSLAECGYKSGLLYGNFEWMAPFTLICLSLFFAPFYIRSGVATLPDFLERRYNRACRDWLAILSLVAAVVIHIGFAFYTGARVLHGMFGIDTNVCIFVVAALAGLYTVVGGLLAVMWTESIQTIILLAGAISITLIGLFSETVGIGGWNALSEHVHPVNFSIIRPASDPTGLSLWSVFLGYPVIGLWYWCCDQVIVQRVLAAKDENHARIGPLFTGFIKILPMFIFVLPGLICLGLVQSGIHTDPLEDPKDALTYLINHVLPTGMKGLMAAALLAAMMGSVSAALNSIATVFSFDIVKRYWPATTDRTLVFVGRIVTAVAMVVAIIWSPLIGNFGTIFQGLNDLICYMAPPVTAIFLMGVFWRRSSGVAALVTLWSGAALGVAIFVIDFFKLGTWRFPVIDFHAKSILAWSEPRAWDIPSMISGFFMFLIATLTIVVISLVFPQRHTAESEALVWKSPLEPLRGKAWRFLGNYRVLAALLFLTMVGLYWAFAGREDYYPVQFTVTLADGSPVRGAEVTLQCENPTEATSKFVREFKVVTDEEGMCGFGTQSLAGGAPAGTVYRVKIDLGQTKIPPTAVHAKYGDFATSGVEVTVLAQRNAVSLKLDPPDTTPANK
jgi:SSS family solute:Na+ symporter